MIVADKPQPSPNVTLGSVSVRGAPRHRGDALVSAVTRGLGTAMQRAQPGQRNIDLPDLKIRLPAGASDSDIQAAIEQAITRAVSEKRS